MQTFSIRKAAVRSSRGLVAAQNLRAAEAGADILRRGGNAMDAAIVTALVLSVVEPWLSGIGGGGFLLRADGGNGKVDALDFNMRAPINLDPADYPLVGSQRGDWFDWPTVEGDRNQIGYSSVCTPGAIAGFAAALERYGSIAWEDALQPAIDAAERGLEIDWFCSLSITTEARALARYPDAAALFLDNGAPPSGGERGAAKFRPMTQKAATLRRLARAGARDFYEGEIARNLIADLAAGGSRMVAADFSSYRAEWGAPLVRAYRAHDLYASPGLSGGPSFLDACDHVLRAPIDGATNDEDAALVYATAIRDAYEKRWRTMGHAAGASCTSHVSVVDAQGTMVSLTNTLLSRFGAKVAPPSGGFLMNNGVMWFDPRPGRPNSIAPGVKPLANMCPIIALRDGEPSLALGAAGGRTIFPALVQIVSSLFDRGLSLEDAFHAARLDASAATVKINAKADPAVAATVASRHTIEIVEDTLYPVNFAVPSGVMRDPDGAGYVGMAHPTSPWAAVAAA